jgi:hypothetical protein
MLLPDLRQGLCFFANFRLMRSYLPAFVTIHEEQRR